MPQTDLNINTNITELIAGLNRAVEATEKLAGETREYQQKSNQAFGTAETDIKEVNQAIKDQEKILKDLTREAEKYAKRSKDLTDAEQKAYKRLQGDIKVAGQELATLKQRQQELQPVTSKLSGLYQKLGVYLAGAFSVAAVTRFLVQSVKAYDEQQRSEAKLLTALKGRYDIQQRLIKQASDIQSNTRLGDEQLIDAQARLARILGSNEGAIRRLLPLVADFATAQGMGLAQAADLVAKAAGSSTNSLARYGIKLESSVGSAERLEEIIRKLNDQVGGQAVAAAEAGIGSFVKLNNVWGDTKESIGAVILSLGSDTTGLIGLLRKIIEMNNQIAEFGFQNLGISKELASLKEAGAASALQAVNKAMAEGKKTRAEIIEFYTNHYVKALQDAEFWAEHSSGEQRKRYLIIQATAEGALAQLRGMKNEIIDLSNATVQFQTMSNAELINLEKQLTAVMSDQLDEQQQDDLKAIQFELKKRRDAFKERVDQFNAEMELDRLASEFHIDWLKTEEQAEKDAFEAEQKRLELQQKRVDSLTKSLEKLTEAFRDEENVADIPFDTEAIVKKAQEVQKWAEENPFWASLGLENDEQLDAIENYANEALDFLNQIIDQQVEANERIVDNLNQRINEQSDLVEQEFEMKQEGLANNYELERENLQKMQEQRDQALKDQEQSIKLQRTLANVESGISLVVAAANIMKGFSEIPIVGVILGIAAVGAMLAAFLVAKSNISDATKLEKGGRLDGPRHSEGGMRIQGTNYEVEGKEWFVNAQSSEKYNDLLTAINKDDQKALQIAVNKHNLIKAFPVNTSMNIDDSVKLGEIIKLLRNEDGIFMGKDFYIEKRGTLRKTIRLN